MTKTLADPPRALLSRPTLAPADHVKRLAAQVDEAIASINAMASSRSSLENQNDRLRQKASSLQREVESATRENVELARRLAEAIESTALISQQAATTRERLTEALANLRLAEQLITDQRTQFERLVAAVGVSTTGKADGQSTSHVRLVGSRRSH